MPVELALGTAAVGFATVGYLWRRERVAKEVQIGRIFDDCRCLFDLTQVSKGADGFPILDGRHGGCPIRLRVIPDTLTLRRLPQLWLSVTLRKTLPIDADLALLARPTGAEFFSTTHRLPVRLTLPSGLNGELLARGSSFAAQPLAEVLASQLDNFFADQRVKEVAVTRQGLRTIFQADQGKRGDYLLLRQSTFANSKVDPKAVMKIIHRLDAVEANLVQNEQAVDPRISAFA